MTIFLFFYDRVFESNRNFITEHVKIVKIHSFSRFPGKVATLNIADKFGILCVIMASYYIKSY